MNAAKITINVNHIIKAGFLLLTLLCLQSCLIAAGVAVGGAGVAYIKGEYKENISASMEQADEAVRKTMIELQYIPINHTKGNVLCTHIVRSANDKKVTITLKTVVPNATSVKIRIGMFGDEAQSRLIMDKIRHNL